MSLARIRFETGLLTYTLAYGRSEPKTVVVAVKSGECVKVGPVKRRARVRVVSLVCDALGFKMWGEVPRGDFILQRGDTFTVEVPDPVGSVDYRGEEP